MKWLWLVLGIFTLCFTGCGTPSAQVNLMDLSTPAQGVVDNDPVFVSPISVLPTPAGGEIAEIGGELAHLVEDDLGLPADALLVISVEAKTWGDASLGCPQPGMSYAQILTDGWLVVYRGPDGQEILVHTEVGMKHYVICNGEFQPLPSAEGGDFGVLPVLSAAVSLLAETLDVPPDKVAVQGIAHKQWNNSCLGCAGPGENCLMVITPGYQVQLTAEGRGYTVHTNADASAARVCEKPDGSDPGGD